MSVRTRITPVVGAVIVAGLVLTPSLAIADSSVDRITGTPQEVTIPIPGRPYAVAADKVHKKVFVANNSFAGSVSVIDVMTNTVTATIPVGSYPSAIDFDSVKNTVVVTNSASGSMSMIDAKTNSVVATTHGLGDPEGVAIVVPVVGKTGSGVYVTDRDSGSVHVLSRFDGVLEATIPVGDNPLAIAVHTMRPRAYVTTVDDNGAGSVSVIDTDARTVVATVPVGQFPAAVAVGVHGALDQVYVTNSMSGSVTVIDPETNIVNTTIPIEEPASVATNDYRGEVYVSSSDGSVSVIDIFTNTVKETIAVETLPFGIAVDWVRHKVYVANTKSGSVSVLTRP